MRVLKIIFEKYFSALFSAFCVKRPDGISVCPDCAAILFGRSCFKSERSH